MFSKQANYSKLKTNLRLVINRLKLLEKKKTELALKARKEISDYIQAGKDDRARIRVEHIVREDYLVEAMEIIEMYCDLLLARFGLISSQKELDPGLEEAVATLIWVTPRLQADIAEFKSVAEQLTLKYSKEFAQACLSNEMNNVSEKVMHKLGVQAPPKLLVERYLIEIAKSFNVPFTPDPDVMREEEEGASNLIDIDQGFDSRKGGGSGGGVAAAAAAAACLQYRRLPIRCSRASRSRLPFRLVAPPLLSVARLVAAPLLLTRRQRVLKPPPYQYQPPPPAQQQQQQMINDKSGPPPGGFTLPDLPGVPNSPANSYQPPQQPPGGSGGTGGASEDVDFDDLTRRFEELKKRK
uniref:IST1 homolog n=1 Tax=Macrostomum lignano TaxID=282301 RepID=A0A1I8HIQ3_9PLAT